MTIEIALLEPERHVEFTGPLRTAFGLHLDVERAARMQRLPDFAHRIGAFEDGKLVGTAGGYSFDMSTPGGSVPIHGLTAVAVLPTHRRRGILTSMLRRHFEEAAAHDVAVSALWASEGSIYGRFGYGVATMCGNIELDTRHAVFRKAFPQQGALRLVEDAEAMPVFHQIYERTRAVTPGMMSRSPSWWEHRRLLDIDKSVSPLQKVVLEIDGKAEGYAIYRFTEKVSVTEPVDTALAVWEAIGTSPRATAQVWRYLFEMDLVRRVRAYFLPVTHPLVRMLHEPRRLNMVIGDSLWVRLIDVEAALAKRTWPTDRTVTFALHDTFCPWNSGVYRIGEGRVARPHAQPDLKLDAAALGSLYLGGVSVRTLAEAGDVDELTEGAIDRADSFFRSAREPWCPEMF